jgi:LacI family transcriptional regulator
VKITIHDVAKQAGVSIKTVSRVLNSEPHVKEAVRTRVQAVIQALDYRPNAFARSLSSSRSYVIGFFSDAPAWSFYQSQLQREALVHCKSKGYHLIVEPVEMSDPEWAKAIESSHSRLAFEGAILAPPSSDALPLIELLERLRIPVVRISPGLYEARSGLVQIDEAGAAAEMTRHIIDLGHTEVAFIGGPASHIAASRRRAGFVGAMERAGLVLREDFILEGDFTFASGSRLGDQLLGGKQRPTAIFAANDDMALGVASAANRSRLSIPKDLSISGFDDTPNSRSCWPTMTTVRQPIADIAREAADIITSAQYRDDTSDPQYRRNLTCEMVLRDSTAPRT